MPPPPHHPPHRHGFGFHEFPPPTREALEAALGTELGGLAARQLHERGAPPELMIVIWLLLAGRPGLMDGSPPCG